MTAMRLATDAECEMVYANASAACREHVTTTAMIAAAAFRVRGWTWHDEHEPPTVRDIERRLWSLIGSAAINATGSCSSGRLHADVGEEGDIHLSMTIGCLEAFIKDAA